VKKIKCNWCSNPIVWTEFFWEDSTGRKRILREWAHRDSMGIYHHCGASVYCYTDCCASPPEGFAMLPVCKTQELNTIKSI
jgi:hypothetical protein